MFQSLTNKFIPNLKESSKFYRAKIGIFQGKVSITVNSFLFIIKLSIGIITGAISLIVDAIHTLSDMITSGIVIWGFKQTDKPADARHPYGHGRAEYIATLIIAVLLCVAGIEFIEVSIERIRNPIISSPEWWMVGMIVFTIIIKEITARYAKFLSSKIASGLLHADAWHHRMDAISSTLVICALIAGKYGFPTIDGWAGLGVAMLLIYTGFDIARDSVDDLIGTPPNSDELDRIKIHGGITKRYLDVTDGQAVAELALSLGEIDVLCNIAGYVHHGNILDTEENDWDFWEEEKF